jgi:hypothetical protein
MHQHAAVQLLKVLRLKLGTRSGVLEKRLRNGWKERQVTIVVLQKAGPRRVDQSWKVSWAPHMVTRSQACAPMGLPARLALGAAT